MEYEKPVQPPPAIVISVKDFAGQFGLSPDRVDRVVEARRLAIDKIDQYVAGLNAGREAPVGCFAADKELSFRIDRSSTLATAVTQALKLPDERLLTPGSIDFLINANRSNQPLVEKLTELRDSLAKGGPVPAAPIGAAIALKSAEGLRYEMLQNQALIDMLHALPDSLLNAKGKDNRDQILVLAGRIAVHKEAQALGLEIERDNAILRLRAEDGALPILQELNPRLETLGQVAQRARKLNLPEPQLQSVERIAEQARAQSAESTVDASRRAAQIAEMRGDGAGAMRYLNAAKSLVERHAAPEKREAELSEVREQARFLISRTVSADLVKGVGFADFRKSCEQFFSGPELEVVTAQSLLRAAQLHRNQQLMKGIDDQSDKFGKECYARAAASYEKALSGLGYASSAKALTLDERVCAYEASNFLLERALTEGNKEQVAKLVEYRRAGIQGALEPEQRSQEQALKVRLARAVFEAPAKYGPEISQYLGVPEGLGDREARSRLLDLVKTRMGEIGRELDALAGKENASPRSQRTLYQDISDAQVATSRMLVHGVVALRGSAEEKLDYYRQLDGLNGAILKSEQELIDRLKREAAELEKARGAAVGRQAMIDDRITVLKAEIRARELSAATILVQQAEVALHGNHPELTRAAKELIERAERFGEAHPGIQRLAKTFRESNNPGSLQAAVEEFLAEVNKDYPPYVLGAMIAAGILGAAAGYGAWKSGRGALYGFMAASCLTLGATKLYYGAQGWDQVQAAYQTGLSPHSPSQDFLNVLYLGADLAQTWPLIPAALGIWALARMRGRKEEIASEVAAVDDAQAKTILEKGAAILAAAGREGVEFGKALVSLADPRTFTFWLLAATIGTASYQVFGSDLPGSVQQEQMTKLGWELMQTLSIAIIYDRIAANLAGNKKGRDAAKDIVAALNGAEPQQEQPKNEPN